MFCDGCLFTEKILFDSPQRKIRCKNKRVYVRFMLERNHWCYGRYFFQERQCNPYSCIGQSGDSTDHGAGNILLRYLSAVPFVSAIMNAVGFPGCVLLLGDRI